MLETVTLLFQSRQWQGTEPETTRFQVDGTRQQQSQWVEFCLPDGTSGQTGTLVLRFGEDLAELESHYDEVNVLRFSTHERQSVSYQTSQGSVKLMTEVLRYQSTTTHYLLHYRLWNEAMLLAEIEVQLSFGKELEIWA